LANICQAFPKDTKISAASALELQEHNRHDLAKVYRKRSEMSQIEALVRIRRLTATGTARAIRVSAGLSLAELAKEVGVAPGTVLRWERAERAPHGEKAVAYAEVLDRLSAATRL
jgi:DNA-binding XRE family transcriptional regulator